MPVTEGESSQLELGVGSDEVVAQLTLAAPHSREFILRGTFPVPRKTYTRDDGRSPFVIRASHGQISQAQVEIVSRYPSARDGADVVEVLARVQRPPGSSPGDRIFYDVLRRMNHPTVHRNTPSVRRLLGLPGSVVLRTTDVFGHKYEADLLYDLRVGNDEDLRYLRDGSVARQVRTYENLEPRPPVPGSLGTLPHMMGVHSFVTTWEREEYVSLDLRLHNGHDGLFKDTEADDPMGKLYFNELELVVPEGWSLYQAFPTPSMGSTYTEGETRVTPLVAPIGGGKLHMMPPQAQFHRRLVLVRDGFERRAISSLKEEGLAMCRDGSADANQEERLYSWWNPRTSRYWAQNLPLPSFNYLETPAAARAELAGRFDSIRSALTQGTPGPWPIVSGNLGWAHPWGHKIGFLHGGSEIYYFDGLKTAWAASREGYRTYQMSHRMYSERHPTALYDLNGDSFHLEDWIVDGPDGRYLPTWIFMVPWLFLGDPFGFTTAPTFQVEAVANQDRQPSYERDLLDFEYIDAQHLIRYTRSAKVLAWLGNDAIAKDDLHMQAELGRVTYSALPQNEFGQGITTGLYEDREYVDSHPHDGFVVDRGEGWILDTVASAYALGDPRWRNAIEPWFEDVVDLMVDGQSACSGTIMSKPNMAHFDGQYRFVQSISECIIQNGLWGVRTSVFEDAYPEALSNVDRVLATSAYAMIGSEIWDPTSSAPHFYTALGPYDQNLPSFCGYVPQDGHEEHDSYQTWNVYVFGFNLTGDLRFIQRAADMAGGTLSPLTIGLGNNEGELETRAGMISFLQTRRSLMSDLADRSFMENTGSGAAVSNVGD